MSANVALHRAPTKGKGTGSFISLLKKIKSTILASFFHFKPVTRGLLWKIKALVNILYSKTKLEKVKAALCKFGDCRTLWWKYVCAQNMQTYKKHLT